MVDQSVIANALILFTEHCDPRLRFNEFDFYLGIHHKQLHDNIVVPPGPINDSTLTK